MTRPAADTTEWVARNMSKMDEVLDAEVIGPHTLRITRKKYDPFVAAIIAVPVVRAEDLDPVLDSDPSIEIAVNVPKESYWTGDAIDSAAARDVAFGSMADLMSAVSRRNVREFQRREYEFVERGLKQHSKVSSFEREFDRVYLVRRGQLQPLRFVMLNEYELTADHVRTARARYGAFDVVLLNNPNGEPTSDAIRVARSMQVRIYKWAEFFGRLNRK